MFQFSLKLWPTLATFAFIPICVHLSLWQSDKALQKSILLDTQIARLGDSPKALPKINPLARTQATQDHALIYTKVSLHGRYIPNKAFLLDNQQHGRDFGFHLFAPFEQDDGVVVWVNRGWMRFSGDRKKIPRISIPTETLSLTGYLWPIHEQTIDSRYAPKAGDAIWQVLDGGELVRLAGKAIYPLMVRMEGETVDDATNPSIINTNTATPIINWGQATAKQTGNELSREIAMHRSYTWQWRIIALATFLAWLGFGYRQASKVIPTQH